MLTVTLATVKAAIRCARDITVVQALFLIHMLFLREGQAMGRQLQGPASGETTMPAHGGPMLTGINDGEL